MYLERRDTVFRKISLKLKKFKKNERGVTSYEVAIACIIFIILFSAFVDVIQLAHAHITTTTVAKDLARTMSVQGGVWENAPEGYTENYYTLSELKGLINAELESIGIETDEWAVYVKGADMVDYYTTPLLTSSSQSAYTADYMESFTVKIVARYKWRIFGGAIGLPVESTFNITMPGLSEWKYDYGDWEGA